MIVVTFLITNQANHIRFFKRIFLVTNISPEVVFGIIFNVRVQIINSTMLDTYKMAVAAFSVTDKANQVRFFEETFLVANISPKVVIRILFPNLSGADIDFLGQEL